jgi:hypothetical protein
MNIFQPPGDCPVCGDPVPAGVKACPSCGACPETGWDLDEAVYDALDLPTYSYQDADQRTVIEVVPPRNLVFNSWQRPIIAFILLILFVFGSLWFLRLF